MCQGCDIFQLHLLEFHQNFNQPEITRIFQEMISTWFIVYETEAQKLSPVLKNYRLQRKTKVGCVYQKVSAKKVRIVEKKLPQSIPLTENRFEPQSTDSDGVEFDMKPESSTIKITQNAVCNGNVYIEVKNNLLKVLSVNVIKMKLFLANIESVYYMEESGPVKFELF